MKKLLLFTLLLVCHQMTAQLYLNEIMIDPPGTDNPNEYIELRGTPGATLVDTYLLTIEGDGNDPGDVNEIINLSGLTIGTNGYLVLLTTGHPYTVHADATIALDLTDGELEGQSMTLLLIESASTPSTGDDIDSDNDGTPDGTPYTTWTILDSFFMGRDNDSSGEVYAYSLIGILEDDIAQANPTLFAPSGANIRITTGAQFDYAARIGNSTGSTLTGSAATSDWYTGDISSGGLPNWMISGTDNRAYPSSFEDTAVDNIGSDNIAPNVWDGSTDNDWHTAANWSLGTVPTADEVVAIPAGLTNYPTATAAAVAHSLDMVSGTSFIANGGFTHDENFRYARTLATTNWYLVSNPMRNEEVVDMIINNNFNTNGSSEISFATYDNTQVAATDKFSYFLSSVSASNDMPDIKGYATQLSAAGDIVFSGSFNTASSESFALVMGGASGDNYNLIGNPYPAYANSATFLGLESGDIASETIWIWNQATNTYDTKVTIDNYKVAPAQGFFVEASTTNNFIIRRDQLSHESTDTFQKTSEKVTINLNLSDGSNNRYMKLYYIDETTTGFDNGFDGKLFDGVIEPFNIYSHLVTDSQGVNYQVQSLPKNYENMIVPIGVNALSGKEITFSAEALNLPTGINVYLEDRLKNTYTRLDEANDTYKVTLSETLDGVGRFYLHTSANSALSVDDNLVLDNISIYKANASTLRIVGLQQGKANITLYNVLGKQIMTSSFEANGVKNIPLPNLAKGVYIVQLETENGILNKKIILE